MARHEERVRDVEDIVAAALDEATTAIAERVSLLEALRRQAGHDGCYGAVVVAPGIVGYDDGCDRWIAEEDDYAAAVEAAAEKIMAGRIVEADMLYDALCECSPLYVVSVGGDLDHLRHVAGESWDEVAEWLGLDGEGELEADLV